MPKPRSCPGKCNVLLIGSGGREHALAWQIRKSPRLGKLWVTHPGNAGIGKLGKPCSTKMDMKNVYLMKKWCDENKIHLVVVGPEAELAKGITEALQNENRLVFGPTKAAAQLEADKAFAKTIMRQAAIPTAEARVFENVEDAKEYVIAHEAGFVVKASGLAAGKGVIVCDTQEETIDAIDQIAVHRNFGDAGATFLIEEKLQGQEVSVLALVDGRNIWILDPCQDHKQRDEGDVGPNTGGMGAYCPAPVLDDATLATIEREVLVPVVDALRRDGVEYRGVLYAGIMLTPGGPKVLEFNCRFGDPECQPLMARFKGDIIETLWSTAAGQLHHASDLKFDKRVACCVVMCSGGYPGAYEKGKPITGIEEAEALGSDDEEVIVFHAGSTISHNGELVTHGGRVLGVTALAADLRTARDLANAACEKIHFEGAFFRRDIGHRILNGAAATT